MALRNNRIFNPALAGVLGLLVSGCSGDRRATPGPITAMPIAALGQSGFAVDPPADYQLGARDVVEVKVYGEPDLSFSRLAISQKGEISMPFVGEVRAAGLTTTELTAQLRAALSRHLIQPQIAVNVVEYGSQRITVEGSVTRAGVFIAAPGTTLLGALAMAGEPDRLGLIRQIAIFRNDAQGRSVALFDLHEIRAGRMIDPVLQGNDRVVVGVSGLGRAYQDLLQAIPAAALFTRF